MPTKRIDHGITRFNREGSDSISNGYFVRLTRAGTTHSKFFSDTKNGGKRKALAAAKTHRDQMLDELPPRHTTKGLKTSRNSSGVVGVHLSLIDGNYPSYCASWKGDKKRQKISFSINKYGKMAAFKLAKIARKMESHKRMEVESIYQDQTGKTLKCYR